MKRWLCSTELFSSMAALLMLLQTVSAQSLGDVARQQRERNKQPATTTNKVITNEDIAAPGPAGSSSSDSQQKKSAKQKPSLHTEASEDGSPSADELKAAIQEKKRMIAEIQDRIIKVQSTINYVQNNRNLYTNAPEYNDAQKRKEQEVNRLKGVLQEQQEELKELQETARNAGYGSALYQ